MTSNNLLIQYIVHQLQTVQNGQLWVGANYTLKLNQLHEQQMFTRPLPDLHSVAEIISHLTLWRNETILKIETGQGSKTDDCPENWLPNEVLEKLGWKQVRVNYEESLVEMVDLLKDKQDDFLQQMYYDTDFKGDYPYAFALNGMLHHDLYHLGQIGIIVKLLNKKGL
ncbi:MAG TPA: DinB family protein [Microscillaceae bacterium]|nr:DinB family protein [Microscillaceae bacterium]